MGLRGGEEVLGGGQTDTWRRTVSDWVIYIELIGLLLPLEAPVTMTVLADILLFLGEAEEVGVRPVDVTPPAVPCPTQPARGWRYRPPRPSFFTPFFFTHAMPVPLARWGPRVLSTLFFCMNHSAGNPICFKVVASPALRIHNLLSCL